MSRARKTWTGRVLVLVVVTGLLALVGVGCAGGVGEEELAELEGRLADVERKVDAAHQAADEALAQSALPADVVGEEELAELEGRLDDVERQVDIAQQTADEALAQSALPADPAPAGERVALARGIALTYEHEGEAGLVTYPVNATYVYDFYGEFQSAWGDRPGVIVELAWIGGDSEGAWQLHYVDRELVRDGSVIALSDGTLAQWHEYLVYTQAGDSTGTDHVLSPVWVDRSRQQSIVGSTARGSRVEGSAAAVGPSITDLGEMEGGRPFARFLLTEATGGAYTLVTVLQPFCDLTGAECGEFQPPDDVDSAGQQNCTNCVWGICVACWW